MDRNAEGEDISALDYWPLSGEPIYHYCPAPAFWSICRNRAIWLTGIHALNDSRELSWGREIVDAVFANNALRFTPAFRLSLTRELFAPDGEVLPLIASFSREGDLLSQWRAYADDAAGFVIEFDASVFTNSTPVRMKEVLYDASRQMLLVLNTILSAVSFIEDRTDDTDPDVLMQVEAAKFLVFHYQHVAQERYVSKEALIQALVQAVNGRVTENVFRQKVIAKLRDAGVLIASSSRGGYKIPASVKDLIDFVELAQTIVEPMLHRVEIARERIRLASNSQIDILSEPRFADLRKLLEKREAG